MPDKLHQILTYSSRCYHNYLDHQPDLARGYLAIVDKTNNVIQGANDPADLLNWLKRALHNPGQRSVSLRHSFTYADVIYQIHLPLAGR
jgi:hypothetical protein